LRSSAYCSGAKKGKVRPGVWETSAWHFIKLAARNPLIRMVYRVFAKSGLSSVLKMLKLSHYTPRRRLGGEDV
jgi:hypothetical protein